MFTIHYIEPLEGCHDRSSNMGKTIPCNQTIITGIGFVGAGLIFTNRSAGIQGVTTAATVFATAAMGCAVGLGFQVAGLGMTIKIGRAHV